MAAIVGRAWRRLVSPSVVAAAPSRLSLRALSSTTTTTTTPTPTPTPPPVTAPGTTRPPKHKTPRKRATSILAELRQAEHAKGLQANLEKGIPEFRTGDSIEVKMVTHLSSKETDTYRGVVLARRNNGPDSRFTLADVFLGTPLLNDIPLYSPFIKSIKVLEKAYIHKGKKRVRRSKLYYLWEKRDPKEYTITG